MAVRIQVTGVKELQQALLKREAEHQAATKRIIRNHGAKLQRKMMKNAVFTKGYSQGDTQASIGLEITLSGFAANVGPTTHYAPYLEYGTRFMEAQPFVDKSLQQQKPEFFADLNKLMK